MKQVSFNWFDGNIEAFSAKAMKDRGCTGAGGVWDNTVGGASDLWRLHVRLFATSINPELNMSWIS